MKQLLTECHELQILSIEEQVIPPEVILFSMSPSRIAQLQQIKISNLTRASIRPLTDSFLCVISRHCIFLTCLFLSTHVSLTLPTVTEVLRKCKRVEFLYIEPFIKESTECSFCYQRCSAHNSRALELSFVQEVFTSVSSSQVTSLLRTVKGLSCLRLHETYPHIFTDRVAQTLCAESAHSLDHLEIVSCESFSASSLLTCLTACTALSTLEIQECDHFGEEGMNQLLDALSRSNRITHLAIHSELLTTSGLLRGLLKKRPVDKTNANTTRLGLTHLTLLPTDRLDVQRVRRVAGRRHDGLVIGEYCVDMVEVEEESESEEEENEEYDDEDTESVWETDSDNVEDEEDKYHSEEKEQQSEEFMPALTSMDQRG
eukprot:gene21929-28009_t